MVEHNELLKLAAYVGLSSYRVRALKVLDDNEAMIPKYIAMDCRVRSNHISKTLHELKDKGLVVCINPEARKGRLYQITPLGHDVIGAVPKIIGKTMRELNDL